MDQISHNRRRGALAAQLVVDTVKRFRNAIQSLPARTFKFDHTPADQSSQHSRYGPNLHTCTRRNLASARRLPQINQREIHAAFNPAQGLQMTAKILGMIVNHRNQFLHQLAQ